MLKFHIKGFRSSVFTNPVMNLVYILYEDIFGPKFYAVLSFYAVSRLNLSVFPFADGDLMWI